MQRDALDLTAAGAKLTPHFPPVVVNRPARWPGSRLRVVLLNAAGGRGLREIAGCLKRPPLHGADVILLCEVNSRKETNRSRGREVALELSEMLEMSCAYIPEFGFCRPDGEVVSHIGNAILSSVPFEGVAAVAMHRPRAPMAWPTWPMRTGRLKRLGTPTGLVTRVRFGGEELSVGVAHLHSRCAPAERARQMETYLESFPASGRAIFGGDLNTTTTELSSRAVILATAWQLVVNPERFHAPQAYEPLFEHLREHRLEIEDVNVANRPTFTFSGLIPRSMRPKLDWLAVRDLHPIAGTAAVVTPRSPILMRRVSDHDFVTVDLEL
jgi:endonuclease/exonuclease/phosphatase family metal-dependent hydrolase